jgi:hypothetical protein
MKLKSTQTVEQICIHWSDLHVCGEQAGRCGVALDLVGTLYKMKNDSGLLKLDLK